MDLEQCARQLMNGEKGEALRRLTESGDGAALAARFDGEAVGRAARSGDAESLAALLKSVLSTPEGARFAEQVRRTVNGHGG